MQSKYIYTETVQSSVGLKLWHHVIACLAWPCLILFFTFWCLISWWDRKCLTRIYSTLFHFYLQTHVDADGLFKLCLLPTGKYLVCLGEEVFSCCGGLFCRTHLSAECIFLFHLYGRQLPAVCFLLTFITSNG